MIVLTDEQRMIVRQFRSYFTNTGGNDPEELIERKHVNSQTNLPVAILQMACLAQLQMLERLRKEKRI